MVMGLLFLVTGLPAVLLLSSVSLPTHGGGRQHLKASQPVLVMGDPDYDPIENAIAVAERGAAAEADPKAGAAVAKKVGNVYYLVGLKRRFRRLAFAFSAFGVRFLEVLRLEVSRSRSRFLRSRSRLRFKATKVYYSKQTTRGYRQALAAYDVALKYDPSDMLVHGQQCACHLELGKTHWFIWPV